MLDLGELNLDSLKEHEEDFDLNPIFRHLYNKADYSKDTSCFICVKKKGRIMGMQQIQNCAFCGRSVCKDCAPKKRPNPRPPKKDEVFRICKVCDQEYLCSLSLIQVKQYIKTITEETHRPEIKHKEKTIEFSKLDASNKDLDLRIRISSNAVSDFRLSNSRKIAAPSTILRRKTG